MRCACVAICFLASFGAFIVCMPAAAEIPVRFTLDAPGFLTLVVEDADGRRVKNLIQDTYFTAGTHTVTWDGYDEGEKQEKQRQYDVHRQRVEPGRYVLRGLGHDDIRLRYHTKLQSPGDPPWHTADRTGGWLADHTPPIDVLYLPDGSPYGSQPQMLVTAPTGEAGHSAIWLTLDGRKLYGTKMQGWRSAKALARDVGPRAIDGYYAYGIVEKPLAIYGLRRGDATADTTEETCARLTLVDEPELPEGVEPWPWLESGPKLGLAVHNGLAVLSFTQADRLRVYDLRKPKGTLIGEIEVDSPRGMRFDPQGRLWLLSGTRLLRFDEPRLEDGELGTATTIVGGLDDPHRLLLDDEDRIFISDGGASHQVKVFTAGGEPIHAIGKPGGKQLGVYDERRMHNPAGLAVDGGGRLWVAELDYAPKRVSVWDVDTGQFVRAAYGPPKYGGGGHLDPRDRTRFYYSSGLQGIEFEVDWTPGASKPRAIYALQGETLGRSPGTPVYRDGRQYMINRFFGPAYFLDAASSIYLYEGDVVRCLARVGTLGRKSLGPWLLEAAGKDPSLAAKMQEAFEAYDGDILVAWSDLNGDQSPQAVEVEWRDTGRDHRHGRPAIGRDFSVTTTGGLYLPPARLTNDGVPVWDLDAVQVVSDRNEPLSDVVHAADDTFIFFSNYTRSRVMRAFRDGELLWKFNAVGGPGRPNPIAAYPGQLVAFSRCIGFPFVPTVGEGGEMFAFKGYHGSIYLMTTDGLYVTDLGGDERTTPALSLPEAQPGRIVDDVSFKSEHFWPAIDQAEDGTVYLTAGKECSCVFDVLGLETIRRLPAETFEVTTAMLAHLPAEEIVPGESRKIEKTMTVNIRQQPPSVDGRLDEWSGSDWVEISPRFGYDGAVAVCGDTLYAAWRTGDRKLLRNSAADGWPYLFATGGALDLMIRTDTQAKPPKRQRHGPENQQAAPGDMRLLVTRVDDPLQGPVRAVRFEQHGERGDSVHYTSPVGEVQIDSVLDISSRVRLAQQDGNYELAVPLDVLGLEIDSGTTTLGDIGLVVGDGNEARARFYWSNKASSATTDIPTEARLLPVEWGLWRFE